MAARLALDRTDKRILARLQDDASITNVALAAEVHLSSTACLRRVERLREAGYLRKTVALLDPALVDLTTLVFVGVVLDRSTPEAFGQFELAAAKLTGCLECHLVAGEFDYMLMIRTSDLQRFSKLHTGEIINLPGVRQVRSFFALKEILSTTSLPV